MALKAGLSETVVNAIAKGRRPEAMSADEAIVYEFTTELLRLQNVSDATYAKARDRFGEPGVIDMVGVAGYYALLSMMMNTARTAVPNDSDVPPLP
jgi:4-carboxymuconolactone decarboxylase